MNDNATDTPHILPLKLYLGIGAALFVLTIITVAVSRVHLGPFNLVAALSIATIKAALVALFFMHLYYDSRMYALIFVTALLFLGIFIIFTMFDTMRRADIYQDVAHPLKPEAVIYDSLRTAPNTLHGER